MAKYYKFSLNAPDMSAESLDALYKYYGDSIKDGTAYQGVLSLGANLMHDNGYHRFAGYCFDLRPFLKCFIVEQYGTYSKIWAKNKTSIRKVWGGTLRIGACPKELI